MLVPECPKKPGKMTKIRVLVTMLGPECPENPGKMTKTGPETVFQNAEMAANAL